MSDDLKTDPEPPRPEIAASDHEEGSLGSGVFFRRRGNRWWLEIRDLPKLRATLGDHLLSAFVRGFAAADRTLTFHHLLGKQRLDEGSEPKTVCAQRTNLTLILLIWATIREVVDVITALAQEDIDTLVADDEAARDAWKALRALAGRWKGSGLQSDIRHKLAYHFDPKVVIAGMSRWCAEKPTTPLTIAWGDGRRELDASFPIGTELGLFALGAETTILKFTEERLSDDSDLSDNVQQVYFLPLPQGQASLRPTLSISASLRAGPWHLRRPAANFNATAARPPRMERRVLPTATVTG